MDSFNQTPTEWLTPREAAQAMGVNVRTLYAWIGQGSLEASKDKDNRTIRISRDNLEAFIQRRNIRKVAGEVVEEISPTGSNQQKREVSAAVFIALAGLQTERQKLMEQVARLQEKVSSDAFNIGQMEEKLNMIGELEDLIVFLRRESEGQKKTNQRLLNLVTIFGVLLIIMAFVVLVCVFIMFRR